MPIIHQFIEGQRFGRLVTAAEERIPDSHRGRPRHTKRVWICACDCGKTSAVAPHSLIYGIVQSCGCWQRDLTSARYLKHGFSHTPEHKCWLSMLSRCSDPSSRAFRYYGGRGITVCERWSDSFENFLADMGSRPSAKHSIDRRDNNGPYSPDNCRWATSREQQGNMRSNRWIEHNGRRQILTDWARDVGLDVNTIRGRLRRGWTTERALTTPARRRAG